MCFLEKKVEKKHKKVEKSFGGVKKGRIFAVPFREGALAPVPGRLDKFIERTGKQGKSKYQGKERANVDSSRGCAPGSYRDEAGPGSDKAK